MLNVILICDAFVQFFFFFGLYNHFFFDTLAWKIENLYDITMYKLEFENDCFFDTIAFSYLNNSFYRILGVFFLPVAFISYILDLMTIVNSFQYSTKNISVRVIQIFYILFVFVIMFFSIQHN